MRASDHAYLADYPGIDGRTAEAVEVLRILWPDHDGPAHIVLADFNLEDHSIQWCINEIDHGQTYSNEIESGHPIFAATRAVLLSMLEVPEAERKPRQ